MGLMKMWQDNKARTSPKLAAKKARAEGKSEADVAKAADEAAARRKKIALMGGGAS